VLVRRDVDDRDLLGGRLRRAVERDGIGGGELRAVDRRGILEEPLRLGAPGLVALFAVVREQVVIPGDPVHRGGERVDV